MNCIFSLALFQSLVIYIKQCCCREGPTSLRRCRSFNIHSLWRAWSSPYPRYILREHHRFCFPDLLRSSSVLRVSLTTDLHFLHKCSATSTELICPDYSQHNSTVPAPSLHCQLSGCVTNRMGYNFWCALEHWRAKQQQSVLHSRCILLGWSYAGCVNSGSLRTSFLATTHK